jgi:hypothetical protein
MLIQRHIPKATEVPEDVLADLDVEERRAGGGVVPTPEALPEEVRSELDHEARLAGEQQLLQLREGRPLAEDDESIAG